MSAVGPVPGGPLTEVLADLHNREIAAIGAEVVELVGAAREVLATRASGADDLVDAGLGFLVQLLEPLERCLDQVDGDTESLARKADEWQRIATDLEDTVHRLDISTRAGWTGPAAESFDHAVGRFGGRITEAASASASVSALLRTSADLMAGARGLVMDIVARVVDFMIAMEAAAEASARFTGGASEAAALTAILGEVSEGVEQAIAIVERVGALLERIGTALRNVSAVFAEITTALAQLTSLRASTDDRSARATGKIDAGPHRGSGRTDGGDTA